MIPRVLIVEQSLNLAIDLKSINVQTIPRNASIGPK